MKYSAAAHVGPWEICWAGRTKWAGSGPQVGPK